MRYLIVNRIDGGNRILSYRYENSEAAANAAVQRLASENPAAFYVEAPSGDPRNYTANPSAKTVTHNPLPPPAPVSAPLDAEELFDLLKAAAAAGRPGDVRDADRPRPKPPGRTP